MTNLSTAPTKVGNGITEVSAKSAKVIYWDGNAGFVEASDMEAVGINVFENQIKIWSAKTGMFVIFGFMYESKVDGEVIGWVYLSQCGKYSLEIFND